MKRIILYIWQLPQTLVGLAVLLWALLTERISLRVHPTFAKGQEFIYVYGLPSAVSFGELVFLNNIYESLTGIAEHHEYGHSRQSRLLGPLYLLVIGLPSLSWNIYYRLSGRSKSDPKGYYRFYTEKWADKLGGVQR